jgi:hypothetical protein
MGSTSHQENEYAARVRQGIPDYIFVPAIGRISVRTKNVTPRTQSLPNTSMASSTTRILSPCDSSRIILEDGLTSSIVIGTESKNVVSKATSAVQEDPIDRAPRVPRRRGSLRRTSSSSSCPLSGMFYHHRETPVEYSKSARALAA